MSRRALIIGAGPAGLTAAYELLQRTDIQPVVLEAGEQVGGLCRTIEYRGNRLDIGGHRFFSKSGRVMRWWLHHLPLQHLDDPRLVLHYRGREAALEHAEEGPDPDATERVMLVQPRQSRILWRGQLYDYPISLAPRTLAKLGPWRAVRMGASYAYRCAFPVRPETNLEQVFINRFGDTLYRTFFKDYTEKVWGIPCDQIGADWGTQRVKDVSVGRAVLHWLRQTIGIRTQQTSTGFIERFLYPKYGPGQMWETVAEAVCAQGGAVRCGQRVVAVHADGTRVTGLTVEDCAAGTQHHLEADYVLSSMPVRELVRAWTAPVPHDVAEVAAGLAYRDFITVGLLVRRLNFPGNTTGAAYPPDSWLYIQEPGVRLGRMQIFNNWSAHLVADRTRVWLGLEYFCNQDDDLWRLDDTALLAHARRELAQIGFAAEDDVLDGVVLRVEKAYPAYYGAYRDFGRVRGYLDTFENLFLIGRNGMHRYNNQDHSMLTAMAAVDNIAAGRADKANIWAVNTDDDYLEAPPRVQE